MPRIFELVYHAKKILFLLKCTDVSKTKFSLIVFLSIFFSHRICKNIVKKSKAKEFCFWHFDAAFLGK